MAVRAIMPVPRFGASQTFTGRGRAFFVGPALSNIMKDRCAPVSPRPRRTRESARRSMHTTIRNLIGAGRLILTVGLASCLALVQSRADAPPAADRHVEP